MAALAAGGEVVTVASTKFPQVAPPMLGLCQSAVAGPPPTAVLIDWSDGTQTTYAVVGDNATAVLYQIANTALPSLLGQLVRITAYGDPGSRVQGTVVQQYLLLDPSGNDAGEAVCVDTPIGFIVVASVFVTPISL